MPVSVFVAVTVAPVMVAPLGSFTVPEMLAVTPAKALPPAMKTANAASARVICLERGHSAGVFLCNGRCSGGAVSSCRLAFLLSFIVPPLREPSLGSERQMRRRVFRGGPPSRSRTWFACLWELCAFIQRLLSGYR